MFEEPIKPKDQNTESMLLLGAGIEVFVKCVILSRHVDENVKDETGLALTSIIC